MSDATSISAVLGKSHGDVTQYSAEAQTYFDAYGVLPTCTATRSPSRYSRSDKAIKLPRSASKAWRTLKAPSSGHGRSHAKGLEFDSVVLLGVEAQTFWGNLQDERAAFFVGISRAKRRLLLTVAQRRQRPAGFMRRWDEMRRSHVEFLGYALTL